MIVPISEPCFQMVVDVKFHPVMALVFLPVQLPGLLRIHRYEKVVFYNETVTVTAYKKSFQDSTSTMIEMLF